MSHPFGTKSGYKAAKLAVRGFPGRHFGSMENGKGFLVYLDGKVIEKHWVDAGGRTGFVRPAAVHIQ